MWNEILVKVKSKDCENVCEIINLLDYDGMYIEDYSDLMDNILVKRTNLIEQELLDKINSDSLIHTYLDEKYNPTEYMIYLENKLNSLHIPYQIEIKQLEEKNWIDEWKKYFKTFKINDVVIVPSWQEYKKENENEKIIHLDPGAAFGTGTHETTKMCIEALQRLIKPNYTVLDIGTGSGILGITAVLCGATDVLGVDIDPLSVSTANNNAQINNVDDKFKAIYGDLTDSVTEKYDVITANIVADVIAILLKDLRRFCKEDCKIILSGIITERKQIVLDAIKENNFTIIENFNIKEWHCIIIK